MHILKLLVYKSRSLMRSHLGLWTNNFLLSVLFNNFAFFVLAYLLFLIIFLCYYITFMNLYGVYFSMIHVAKIFIFQSWYKEFKLYQESLNTTTWGGGGHYNLKLWLRLKRPIYKLDSFQHSKIDWFF